MEFISGLGIGALLATGLVWLLAGKFLPAYVIAKAQNVATKEDVAEITGKVESVKAQYAASLEIQKAVHSLRMAALDRRLQAHQEAFTLWRGIIGTVHTPEVGQAVLECQAWWEKNCIYLEPEIRAAFVDAYQAASSHAALVQDRGHPELVKKNWLRITSFPNMLFAAVKLPELSTVETKALAAGPENSGAGG